MNIIAAILILSASGHAERILCTDDAISSIIARVAWGAVEDVSFRKPSGNSLDALSLSARQADLRLRIDGQPRTGWRSWVAAGWRVAGYAADCQTDGSVSYGYRVRVRRFDVYRQTNISDGNVVLTTDAWWTETIPITKRLTRKVPIHVSIIIRATERGTKTYILGTATGYADTRDFRCRLVRQIAENRAAGDLGDGLRNALAEIERRGRAAYASGDNIADVLDGIHIGIEISGRVRGNRE